MQPHIPSLFNFLPSFRFLFPDFDAIVSDQLSVPTGAADGMGSHKALGLQTAFVAEAHEDTGDPANAIGKPRIKRRERA